MKFIQRHPCWIVHPRYPLAVLAACLVLISGCGGSSSGGGAPVPPTSDVLTDAEIAAAQMALEATDVDILGCVSFDTPSSATVLTDMDIATAQAALDAGMC